MSEAVDTSCLDDDESTAIASCKSVPTTSFPLFERIPPFHSALENVMGDLLNSPPFAGRAKLKRVWSSLEVPCDYAVAIPVRDEAQLLGRAVRALDQSMSASAKSGAAVIVVNNSEDGSADLAARLLERCGRSGAVVEVDFASDICNAPHTRRLALDIAAWLAPDGCLFTTDADSHVGPHWTATCLAQLESGIDLICEDVRLDEAELALLPESVRAVGDAERAYFEASELLWRRWTGERAGTFAYRASGASLAFTTAAYRSIGGLPLPSKGEDAALCEKVLARGYRVRQLSDLGTRTSARLDARAKGGCGETLSHRAAYLDPECDAALVPLRILRKMALSIEGGSSATIPRDVQPMRYKALLRELHHARLLLGERR